MTKLNDNVLQQIDSRLISVKRYNEIEGENKRRRKDPFEQE
tara:strand:- start:360 stop:482 length:123 start_codon:yes stop_codon:yes gene_type:complete